MNWREAIAIFAAIAAYDIVKGFAAWLLTATGLRRSRFRRGWWES